MLPLSNCWRGMSSEGKPFACYISSELHWQLSWAKAHRVGWAIKEVRMTTWLSLFPSCCLSHINPLIHCYILLRCLRAVDLILRTVVPSGILSTNTALSRLSFETFLHEFRYSLLYWVERPCGCLTIERRVRKSIVDVPNQRVRYKLWVCARKLLPVETLTALSRGNESQSGNTNNMGTQEKLYKRESAKGYLGQRSISLYVHFFFWNINTGKYHKPCWTYYTPKAKAWAW